MVFGEKLHISTIVVFAILSVPLFFNEMERKIGKSFKATKAMIYRDHKNGFYVYAKPNQCNPKQIADYIGRYLGRPVIATKRIDKYDGENVTFHYNRHEDEKLIIETVPALEFIERLITYQKNISKWCVIMASMPAIARFLFKCILFHAIFL